MQKRSGESRVNSRERYRCEAKAKQRRRKGEAKNVVELTIMSVSHRFGLERVRLFKDIKRFCSIHGVPKGEERVNVVELNDSPTKIIVIFHQIS